MTIVQAQTSDAPDITPPLGEVLLSATALNAGYGGVAVVKDLELHVAAGEMVALLGANGAGKTTTLMALSGVLPITSGAVGWLGSTRAAPLHVRARAGLGFVPESRSIIASLTTMENLRLGRGSPDDAIDLLPELKPLLRRRAGLLSGGEQQFLTLGRILAARPRLILADEMSLGLAPLIVARLLTALRDVADGGVGVLIVEQQVRNVLKFADRAYVLRRGVVELEGQASDLRARIGEIEATYLTGTATS